MGPFPNCPCAGLAFGVPPCAPQTPSCHAGGWVGGRAVAVAGVGLGRSPAATPRWPRWPPGPWHQCPSSAGSWVAQGDTSHTFLAGECPHSQRSAPKSRRCWAAVKSCCGVTIGGPVAVPTRRRGRARPGWMGNHQCGREGGVSRPHAGPGPGSQMRRLAPRSSHSHLPGIKPRPAAARAHPGRPVLQVSDPAAPRDGGLRPRAPLLPRSSLPRLARTPGTCPGSSAAASRGSFLALRSGMRRSPGAGGEEAPQGAES